MIEEEDLTEDQIDQLAAALLRIKSELPAMSDIDKHKKEIRTHKVQLALARIDLGDYGYCMKCQDPIGFRILEAEPERRFCRKCVSKPR